MTTASEWLTSWRDTPTRARVVDFVTEVTAPGPGFVPVEDRVAVFDNDGTLWCEKPMPVQVWFILARLAEMAQADQTLRTRQPWHPCRLRWPDRRGVRIGCRRLSG